MKLYFLIPSILFLLLFSSIANAAITFTNGYWSSSYGTADWSHHTQTNPPAPFQTWLNSMAGTCSFPSTPTYSCMPEQILLSANNPNGVPGTAAQVHYGWTGTDGNGSHNDMSGGLLIYFPTALNEYWMRLYVYYPTEMGFGGEFNGWKNFYFDNDISNGWYFGFPASSSQTRFYIQSTGGSPDMFVEAGGYGDTWFESSSRQGFGRWIPLEIHFKQNTGSSFNGIIQVWVDNDLIIDHHAVYFPTTGFSRVALGSNGDSFVGPANKAVGIRYDDIAVATTSYTGFVNDQYGNPRIGLLDGGGDPGDPDDTTPPLRSNKAPIGELAVGTLSTTMSLTTNENATCRWSDETPDIAYADMTNTFDTTGETSHSQLVTGLTNGTSYNKLVRCIDAAGNANTSDYWISFSVADSTAPPPDDYLIFHEPFSDNSWTNRGWYDGVDSTGSTAGGYSGNGLKWTWASGNRYPTGFSTIRKALSQPLTRVKIQYYIKMDTGWRGSGETYHPHMIYLLSDEESTWAGLSRGFSTIYSEIITDTTSPYNVHPMVAYNDFQRVNTSHGTPPVDLRAVTETRSSNQCNQPYTSVGASHGTCYNDGVGWYSANGHTSAVTIPNNTWVKVDLVAKMNTFTTGVANFDGVLKVWLDDNLVMNNTGMMYAAGAYQNTAWQQLVLGPYIGNNSPIAQSMWIDELKIYEVVETDPPPPDPEVPSTVWGTLLDTTVGKYTKTVDGVTVINLP